MTTTALADRKQAHASFARETDIILAVAVRARLGAQIPESGPTPIVEKDGYLITEFTGYSDIFRGALSYRLIKDLTRPDGHNRQFLLVAQDRETQQTARYWVESLDTYDIEYAVEDIARNIRF